MAIAHIATDSGADTASPSPNPLVVTKPTGVTLDATHILVLTIATGASAATPDQYSTAPTGWTSIGSLTNQANGSDHVSAWMYWSLGNNATLSFTRTGSVGSTVGWRMAAYSGCDTTTPIDATGTPNSSVTNGTTLTTNLVTIATDQAWHLIGVGDWTGGGFTATSFTASNNANPATNQYAGILYNTTPKAVGSTGTVVITTSSSGTGEAIIGIPFALRPAASAAGPILEDLMHRPGFMPILCM